MVKNKENKHFIYIQYLHRAPNLGLVLFCDSQGEELQTGIIDISRVLAPSMAQRRETREDTAAGRQITAIGLIMFSLSCQTFSHLV